MSVQNDDLPATIQAGAASKPQQNRDAMRWAQYVLVLTCFSGAVFFSAKTFNTNASANGTGYESLQTAYSLAHGNGFANPFFNLQSGPTAHLAPVYPVFLSLILRLFGDGHRAAYMIDLLGELALALQISLWPFAARRLGMGEKAGFMAAVLFLLASYDTLPVWEANYIALAVLLLSVGTHRLMGEGLSNLLVVAMAFFWGLTILANPVVLLPYAVFFALILLRSAATAKQKFALAGIPVLMLVPWTVRNYRVFHHVFLVRDNLGLELSTSNNACAEYSFMASEVAHCYFHPNQDAFEAQRLLSVGEYNYNRERLHEATDWIHTNPAKFASLTAQRIEAFWFPNKNEDPRFPEISAKTLAYWAVTLLSVPGLFVLWRRNRSAVIVCMVWLVFYPPIYYITAFIDRYRTPILWATFLPAGYFLTWLVSRLHSSKPLPIVKL